VSKPSTSALAGSFDALYNAKSFAVYPQQTGQVGELPPVLLSPIGKTPIAFAFIVGEGCADFTEPPLGKLNSLNDRQRTLRATQDDHSLINIKSKRHPTPPSMLLSSCR
jgi:hypothetical protein